MYQHLTDYRYGFYNVTDASVLLWFSVLLIVDLSSYFRPTFSRSDFRSCCSSLTLALLIAQHQSRDNLNTSETRGLCAPILCVAGKLRDVQSRRNCVRCCVWLWRMEQFGWTCRTVFSSSGSRRPGISAVALHLVSTCSIVSTGARHSLHCGFAPWSLNILSPVR